MDFRRKSIVDLVATVCSACTSLILAFNGYGVWSLIWSSISLHVVHLVGYNLVASSLVLPKFTFKGIGGFISFGGYTVVTRILWYFYSRSDVVICGRILGDRSLGIYSVALELSSLPLERFLPVINQVAFPAFSYIQYDRKRVCSNFLKAARIVSCLIFPVFWGLLIVAPDLLPWLLGNKWAHIVLPVQVLCMILPFRALDTLFSPMLLGVGKPQVNFLYVAVACFLMPISFLAGAHHGVIGICLAWVIGYSVVSFITIKVSLKVIGLSMLQYISNIITAPLASLTMILLILAAKYLIAVSLPPPIVSFIYILIGMAAYPSLIFLFRNQLFREICDLIPRRDQSVHSQTE